MPKRILLEVPVESLEEAQIAIRAGADRIELCRDLHDDGLTPYSETIRGLADSGIPFVTMIRPRPGDFCYDRAEAALIESHITRALDSGATAIVFGALTPDGAIASVLCRRVIKQAAGLPVVFHRAFDDVADQPAALEHVIDLGFARILTSGAQTCAASRAAASRIAALISQAAGRIEILPGGGIRPANVSELLHAVRCTQVHSSCRQDRVLNPALVSELRSALDSFSNSLA